MSDTPTYDQLSALCAQLAAALEGANDFILDHGDKKKAVEAALTASRTLSPDPVYAEAKNMHDMLSRLKIVDGVSVKADEVFALLNRINRARGEG